MIAAIVHFFRQHWLIFLIILMAGFIRFYDLVQRGLVISDAGFYGNIAKTPIYVLNFLEKGGSISDVNGILEFLKGNSCVFHSEKPGHTFLIFISFLIFGIHDWAILLVSALSGVISVSMVYLIGNRFFSKEVGVISATFLALSGFMVAFSRTGHPQMDTMLMVAVMLYFYFRYNQDGEKLYLYFSAATMGIGLLFHPTFLIVLCPIVLHFFFDYIGNRERRPERSAFFVSLLLFALPILLEEAVFLFANMLSDKHEILGVVPYFFHKTAMQEAANQNADFFSGLNFFFEMMKMTDGLFWALFFILALLFGSFQGIRRKNPCLYILGAQVVLSLALWSWKYPTAKVLPVCYPALSLLAGYSVWEIMSKSRFKNLGLAVAMISVVLSVNYAYLKGQLTLSAQYKQAVLLTKEIVERDGGVFRAKDHEALKGMLSFYMPQINNSQFGIEFKGDKNVTISYEMIDYRKMMRNPDASERLFENCQIVLELRNSDQFLPVMNFHRLKNEGLEYIKTNFNSRWLNLYVFKKYDNPM